MHKSGEVMRLMDSGFGSYGIMNKYHFNFVPLAPSSHQLSLSQPRFLFI